MCLELFLLVPSIFVVQFRKNFLMNKKVNSKTRERLLMEISYSGPDVDDGSIAIDDLGPALQGLASAYGKLTSKLGDEVRHELRITGVRKGSFDLLLEVWKWAGDNSGALTTVSIVGGGVLGAIKVLFECIKLVKHTKNKPFNAKPEGATNGFVTVNNSENVSISVSFEAYESFKLGALKNDLDKLTKPLEDGQIDNFQIAYKHDSKEVTESISKEERPLFAVSESNVTDTKKAWLVGNLLSLHKGTNKGVFTLSNGERVTYKLAMPNPENQYEKFVYSGLVKVECVAHLDENLRVNSIDVYSIEKVQTDLEDS
jgi:hypothetical protein